MTDRSPFFRPSEPARQLVQVQTPGGTRHKITRAKPVEEHKSSRFGCAANLCNAIIGSGIVGIPFAIRQAGFVAGIVLVLLCAVITDKSLRLLIATAKHVSVPSYETLAEAAFGKFGFWFISVNMFIMAYGAMLSYLMIVKDTFSVAIGVDPDNLPTKRAMLCLISLLIIVPLSSQRDMADLAMTSRISVAIDFCMVLVVAYLSPINIERVESLLQDEDWMAEDFWIHTETIFVGLGVLSFAFVCQHSAFIIAGSLEKPTIERWSQVTNVALVFCATLALLCGLAGYLGYVDDTHGNILNNLNVDDPLANVARALLGTTMLFVYPMESFVARHVCVVLLFQGRRAHEGEDASVLARRDRRIGLTLALYLTALLPALLFEDLGNVLACTGAVGGSCLSYIGPGAIYMGIHGREFLQLIESGWWWKRFVVTRSADYAATTKVANQQAETTPILQRGTENATAKTKADNADMKAADEQSPWHVVRLLQTLTWHALLMPIWCFIARFGDALLRQHKEDMALKSPHPMRIGNVQSTNPQQPPSVANGQSMERSDSLSSSSINKSTSLVAPGESMSLRGYQAQQLRVIPNSPGGGLNQQIGQKLLANKRQQHQQDSTTAEDDPQRRPPQLWDFLVAIFFVVFGVIALAAGLVSIGLQEK